MTAFATGKMLTSPLTLGRRLTRLRSPSLASNRFTLRVGEPARPVAITGPGISYLLCGLGGCGCWTSVVSREFNLDGEETRGRKKKNLLFALMTATTGPRARGAVYLRGIAGQPLAGRGREAKKQTTPNVYITCCWFVSERCYPFLLRYFAPQV